jgi:hypothetical protein
MPYFLIPKDTDTRRAVVWLAAVNESVDLDFSPVFLECGAQRLDVRGNWSVEPTPRFIRHRAVPIAGLDPGRRHALSFIVGDQVVASGDVVTLPEQLPTLGQQPFTVLLGSCFWHERDPGLASAFARLPAGMRPDVKILCGDQIYLDAPASHFAFHTHSRDELEASFTAAYLSSWRDGCLGDVLRSGPNHFSSDDHEPWNNAPSRAALVRDSWTDGGRRQWLTAARKLYGLFQTAATVTTFAVGALSFCIADTRMRRDADEQSFMDPADLARVRQWIEGLRGPGVLVIGQPLFADTAGVLGHLFDWGLPDYAQFPDLVRALMDSQHDIVALTGDVHYARAARCLLPSGRRLVEIISSPLALVDEKVGRKWSAAPKRFPAMAVPGVKAADITHYPDDDDPFTETREHFVTLQFDADGAKIRLRALCWPYGLGKGPVAPRAMCTLELM